MTALSLMESHIKIGMSHFVPISCRTFCICSIHRDSDVIGHDAVEAAVRSDTINDSIDKKLLVNDVLKQNTTDLQTRDKKSITNHYHQFFQKFKNMNKTRDHEIVNGQNDSRPDELPHLKFRKPRMPKT